jgi:hypothetical protein
MSATADQQASDEAVFAAAPLCFVTDTEGNLESFIHALRQPHADFRFVDERGMPTRRFRLIFGGDGACLSPLSLIFRTRALRNT